MPEIRDDKVHGVNSDSGVQQAIRDAIDDIKKGVAKDITSKTQEGEILPKTMADVAAPQSDSSESPDYSPQSTSGSSGGQDYGQQPSGGQDSSPAEAQNGGTRSETDRGENTGQGQQNDDVAGNTEPEGNGVDGSTEPEGEPEEQDQEGNNDNQDQENEEEEKPEEKGEKEDENGEDKENPDEEANKEGENGEGESEPSESKPAEENTPEGAGEGEAGTEGAGTEAGAEAGTEAAVEGAEAEAVAAETVATETAVAAETAAVETGAAAGGAAVGWPVIVGVIIVVVIIIAGFFIASYFMPRTHTDKTSADDKTAITQVEDLAAKGKISFSNTDDLAKISDGKIGPASVWMMSALAGKHEKIEVNYGNTNYDDTVATGTASDPAKTNQNEPYEFDVATVDTIKCVDTKSDTTLSPIPISLKSDFAWSSLLKPEYTDQIKCAVGYYPGKDSPVVGNYSSQFGPGIFSITDIASAGPKAAREKTAEIVSEALDANKNLNKDRKPENQIDITPVRIDIASADKEVIPVLKDKISKAYPQGTTDSGVLAKDPLPRGLHISFM